MKKLIVALIMAGFFSFALGCGGTATSPKSGGSPASKPAESKPETK